MIKENWPAAETDSSVYFYTGTLIYITKGVLNTVNMATDSWSKYESQKDFTATQKNYNSSLNAGLIDG